MIVSILLQVALFVAVLVPVAYFVTKVVRSQREIPLSRDEATGIDQGRAAGHAFGNMHDTSGGGQ